MAVQERKKESAKCERCGKKYKRKVFWQKYCSASCKVIAWGLKEFKKENK